MKLLTPEDYRNIWNNVKQPDIPFRVKGNIIGGVPEVKEQPDIQQPDTQQFSSAIQENSDLQPESNYTQPQNTDNEEELYREAFDLLDALLTRIDSAFYKTAQDIENLQQGPDLTSRL